MANPGRSVSSGALFDELDRFVDSEPVTWTERPARRQAEPIFDDGDLAGASEPLDADPDGDPDGAAPAAADAAFSRAPALTRREQFAQRLSEELDKPPAPPPPAAPLASAPPAALKAEPPKPEMPRPTAGSPPDGPVRRTAADAVPGLRPGNERHAPAESRSPAAAAQAAPRLGVPPKPGDPRPALRSAASPPVPAAPSPPPQVDLLADDFEDDDAPADALEWELDNAISAIIANRNGTAEPAPAPAAAAEPTPPRPPVPAPVARETNATELSPSPLDSNADPDLPQRAAVGQKRPRPIPTFQFDRRVESEEPVPQAPADPDNPLSTIFFKDVRENFDAVHARAADDFEDDPGFQMEDLGPDGLEDEYALGSEDEDRLPSSLSRAARRRKRSGMRAAGVFTIAGAVAAVLVVGVIGFNVFAGSGDASKSAPVIHANARDVKVMAENDTLDAQPDIMERTQLGETEALVLPDRVEIGRAATSPITLDSEEDDEFASRRVRTVVVRPDGTIVPAGQAAAEAAAAAPPEALEMVEETEPEPRSNALTPYDVAAVSPQERQPGSISDLLPEDEAAIEAFNPGGDKAVEFDGDGEPVEATLDPADAVVPTVVRPPRRPSAPPVRTARADPPATTQAQQPAAASPAPATAAPAPAATSSRSSPWGVQVSSQRSREDAEKSWDNFRTRYATIVGGMQPMILSADVGDRGRFYRVRLPAGSSGEATALCQRLKSAGADCFVGRN